MLATLLLNYHISCFVLGSLRVGDLVQLGLSGVCAEACNPDTTHLISHFEVFFSGIFVDNVLATLFIFVVSQSQYIVLEKKYSKAKKLLREFQQREQDLLHREEFYLQLLQEKDTEYNALVKTLKDRVSYCCY